MEAKVKSDDFTSCVCLYLAASMHTQTAGHTCAYCETAVADSKRWLCVCPGRFGTAYHVLNGTNTEIKQLLIDVTDIMRCDGSEPTV